MSFQTWPAWQKLIAALVGVVGVLALVRAPDAGATPAVRGEGVCSPLPFRWVCDGYSIVSDVTDTVTSTSKTIKKGADSVENTADATVSATEGGAKLVEKANKGIDGLGEWWKGVQERRRQNAATTTTAPLPPIKVVPVAPTATTSTTIGSSNRSSGGVAIVGPNGERWVQR